MVSSMLHHRMVMESDLKKRKKKAVAWKRAITPSDVKGTIKGEEGEWGVETGRREWEKYWFRIIYRLWAEAFSHSSWARLALFPAPPPPPEPWWDLLFIYFLKKLNRVRCSGVLYVGVKKKKTLTRCKNHGVMDEWKIVWVAGFQRDKSSSCFKWKFQVIFIFMHKNVLFKSNNNTNPGFPAVSL